MDFQQTTVSRLMARLKRARREALRPPPKLNLIEWADSYRFVSKKNSANPGLWQTGRVPCAYGPYLAVTEKDTDTITVMASTQMVKTELLLNIASYFIHQDPASILFVQPTQKLAEDFSKERFAPTRESTPVLRELIPDAKARDSGVTITHKEYPGGTLDFVGANSPVDLASRPKRIVLSDEIDKYPASAGSEGDPLSLAEERASTFWNRKKVRACSPTDEQSSRVATEYQSSDQRRCFVPCPHCGHEQILRFTPETVIWDKDDDGNHKPQTAQYYCEGCGAGWSEAERIRALRSLLDKPDKGWRQTKPFRCCGREHQPSVWTEKGRSLCPDCGTPSHYSGHAGFHVSKLYSTRHKLADVVKEWLQAHKSKEKLRKFVNTALAETWKEKVERLDPKALAERVEPYTADAVPADVQLVTWGGDTQDDRIEVTFQGWGADEECWVLKHGVLLGDTAKKAVWDQLDELIKEPFLTVDGHRLVPQAGCIDSQGHRGEMVHAFCRSKRNRRVYAVKGQGNDPRGSKLIWPKTPSRTKNSGDKLYLVGVDTAKDALASRLAIEIVGEDQPTPFAIHFPHDGLSADYFEQLTAEKAVTVIQHGREYRVWRPKAEGIRNEALDCFVYGLAARLSLPNKLRAKPQPKPTTDEEPVTEQKEPVAANATPEVAPAPIARPSRQRSRWNAYR
ncbi:terminase [Devosia pacifica]|uniref:Terminase n=1 Tax=Devosia pacifica TaxID=1335967 RepID=A0A918VPT0_9HYPH|nr:terminase gpA endonuclease subunit [Devosia pacifica]GHA13447.1 terminase [Devosia pacifica]